MAHALYQRVTCPKSRMLDVMDAGKWHSSTVLAARLSRFISPECAIRLHRSTYHGCGCLPSGPIDRQIASGMRAVVAKWGYRHRINECIEKKKIKGESHYRLTKKGIEHREKTSTKV